MNGIKYIIIKEFLLIIKLNSLLNFSPFEKYFKTINKNKEIVIMPKRVSETLLKKCLSIQLLNQLKHQASSWCDQNIPEQFDEEIMGYGVPWENKFAEMIVRECMQVCADIIDSYGRPVDMDPTEHPNDYIKKHFGVEE